MTKLQGDNAQHVVLADQGEVAQWWRLFEAWFEVKPGMSDR
jgi:hypothetical protein